MICSLKKKSSGKMHLKCTAWKLHMKWKLLLISFVAIYMVQFVSFNQIEFLHHRVKNNSSRYNAILANEKQSNFSVEFVCTLTDTISFQQFSLSLFIFACVCKRVLWHLIGAAEWNENISDVTKNHFEQRNFVGHIFIYAIFSPIFFWLQYFERRIF